MPDPAPSHDWKPALVLALLAPVIGEVIVGAVPLSRLPGLIGLIGLYGSGALLVRELVRQRQLTAAWLVVLGIAYAVIEEGTVVQSLFDQHYPGLSFLGFYGHWSGVNWVWVLFIVPYHAVFSIAIPVLVTELMFPESRGGAWLGRLGLTIAAVLFVVNAALLAVFRTGLFTDHAPKVSLLANVGAALLAATLIAAAFTALPSNIDLVTPDGPPVNARAIRVIALTSGLAWFVGFRVLIIGTGSVMPAPAVLVCGAAILLGIVGSIRIVIRGRAWTAEATYALVAGALPTSWLLGFLIAAVSGGNPVVNVAGHAVFGMLMFVSLRRLHLRIRDGNFGVAAA